MDTSYSRVAAIPSPLHREEDSRVVAVQVIIVKILHHKQRPAIILVSWHHDVIGKGSIVQAAGQQVKTEVVVHCLRVALAVAVDTHKQSGRVTQEPLERTFTTSLLL